MNVDDFIAEHKPVKYGMDYAGYEVVLAHNLDIEAHKFFKLERGVEAYLNTELPFVNYRHDIPGAPKHPLALSKNELKRALLSLVGSMISKEKKLKGYKHALVQHYLKFAKC